ERSHPADSWIWVLHDDCVTQPDTLTELLRLAAQRPQAAVVGPKLRSWNGRYLLEVGASTDRTGRRDSGTERRELDQGQRDVVREVLAVSSAGCLIRRDVWDRLGGYDPSMRLFGEDIDFGWRVWRAGWQVLVAPAAVARHAAAASSGRRDTAELGPQRRLIRHGALFPLLANVPGWLLPVLIARLALSTLLRMSGLVLARQPRAAGQEARALGGLLGGPRSLLLARRSRSRTAVERYRMIRGLLAGPGARLRSYRDALSVLVSLLPTRSAPEPGQPAGRYRHRPAVLLFAALVSITLLAERGLLGASVGGGQLLPAPAAAGASWSTYLAAFHDVGLGSSFPAPPALAVLSVLGWLMAGKPWVAIDLLLLASVPLGGLSAYLAARRLVRSRALAYWAAASWALAPGAPGAISGGRLDGAVAVIGLPVVAVGLVRVTTTDPARHGWWRAFALGLGLALVAAFAPLVWIVAALSWVLLGANAIAGAGAGRGAVADAIAGAGRGAVADAIAGAGRGAVANAIAGEGGRAGQRSAKERFRGLAAGATALVTAFALLLPWSWQLLSHSGLVLGGLPSSTPPASSLSLLLADPGGPGTPPAWLFVPVVGLALLGILRRPAEAITAWLFALVGYAGALVLAHTHAAGAFNRGFVWPGIAELVIAAALLAAAIIGADGIGGRLAGSAFGWRQLLFPLFATAAVVVPVGYAIAWLITGAVGPLQPAPAPATPAFLAAEASTSGGRVLDLSVPMTGAVRYALLPRGRAPTFDSEQLSSARDPALGRAIAELVSGTGSSTAPISLGQADIEYLHLSGPGTAAADSRLAAAPGLVRLSGTGSWALARVPVPLGVLSPGASLPLPLQHGGGFLRPGHLDWACRVPAGTSGRLLVLADSASAGWHAQLAGRTLTPVTAYGWAQAFRLPATGGHLLVSYATTRRAVELSGQLLLLLVCLVLARPGSKLAATADAPGSASTDPSDNASTDPSDKK
ncbi:MAG: glycosyltransferase, partial [Mycobacteriales bacterium]